MAERSSRRSTAVSVFAFVVATVLGVGLALNIADYGVPLPTTIIAGGGLFCTVFTSLWTSLRRRG